MDSKKCNVISCSKYYTSNLKYCPHCYVSLYKDINDLKYGIDIGIKELNKQKENINNLERDINQSIIELEYLEKDFKKRYF